MKNWKKDTGNLNKELIHKEQINKGNNHNREVDKEHNLGICTNNARTNSQ